MNKKQVMKKLIRFLKRHFYTTHCLRKNPFKLLVCTILSQRTQDANSGRACEQLFSAAKTPQQILNLPEKRLHELIRCSGFYKQKSKMIKQTCRILLKKYKGKVPKTRGELLSLPGVGYKTADIVLSYGFGIPTIAVDTHVNRIPKRIGIVPKSAEVEEVRKILEKLVLEKDYFVVNLGLVRFGREVCRPINPKCHSCQMRKVCDFGIKTLYTTRAHIYS